MYKSLKIKIKIFKICSIIIGMENSTMYVYQKYLIKHKKNELNIQKNKLYCDGSMQKYLENLWSNESPQFQKEFMRSKLLLYIYN